MITFFNRALLYKDTNAQSADKIQSALKNAGVPYLFRKEKSGSAKPAIRTPILGKTGNMGTDPHINAYMTGGVPHSWTDTPSVTLYTVYVLKKDLQKAKKLCEIA